MKVVEKIMKLNKRKLFTKKQKNNIMSKNYNLLDQIPKLEKAKKIFTTYGREVMFYGK